MILSGRVQIPSFQPNNMKSVTIAFERVEVKEGRLKLDEKWTFELDPEILHMVPCSAYEYYKCRLNNAIDDCITWFLKKI